MEAKSVPTVHILVAGLLILLVSPALSLRAQSPQVRILSNDTVIAEREDLWEFSCVVAPPGAGGCGKAFLSGRSNDGVTPSIGGVTAFLYQADLVCNYTPCATDVYKMKFPTKPGMPEDPQTGLQFEDFVENDSVMARLPNGRLLFVRGLIRRPPGGVSRSGTMVWGSDDNGNTWRKLSFIDPLDTQFDGGKYNLGWDREEVYADPWTGHAFLSMGGTGLTGTQSANGLLLFRSDDGGQKWNLIKRVSNGFQPLMMTTLPNKLFLFQCFAERPVLWWSSNEGKDLKPGATGATVFWDDKTGPPKPGSANSCASLPGWGVEGSQSISRVGRSRNSKGVGVSTVRITYPSVVNDPLGTRQVLRIILADVPDDDSPVTFRNSRTIEATGPNNQPLRDSVVSATVIEADPSLVKPSGPLDARLENTTFIYWKGIGKSSASGNQAVGSVQGLAIRNADNYSSPITLSRSKNTILPRFWSATKANGAPIEQKTGDYSKGGFYYDSATREFRYFVQWIEPGESQRTLHTTLVGVK